MLFTATVSAASTLPSARRNRWPAVAAGHRRAKVFAFSGAAPAGTAARLRASPSVLHLIEEVLDGTASGIVPENLLGPQFTAGGEEKALLAELARIILELHPHGPDLVTVKEYGQAGSSPVTNPLPLAVEEHPVPHLRQGGNSIRGIFVAILRRPAPFAGDDRPAV